MEKGILVNTEKYYLVVVVTTNVLRWPFRDVEIKKFNDFSKAKSKFFKIARKEVIEKTNKYGSLGTYLLNTGKDAEDKLKEVVESEGWKVLDVCYVIELIKIGVFPLLNYLLLGLVEVTKP